MGKNGCPDRRSPVCAVDDIHHVIRAEFSRPEEEEWNLAGALTQPGQVGFVADLLGRSPLAGRMASTIGLVGLGKLSILAAHLRASDGYEANLAFGFEAGHGAFSDVDLAVIGAVAEFASFALAR